MVTSSSSKNHRLDNNDRRSGGGTSSRSSIRHSNRNKNTNSKNTTQGGSSSSTVLLVWMIIIGCIIFGFISNIFFNTFDLNNIQSVYDDAPSLMSLIQQHPSIKSKSKSLVVLNSHHQQLSELTRSHVQNIECPERLFPFYDRIINTNEQQEPEEQHYLIPKSIHLSWKTRCVPQDMMEIIDKWKEQFPSYNIYFHDDVAVNALLNDDTWYDIFPHFKHIMNSCVKFGSAMTIDLWRILILYRYGGIYADMDVGPGPKLTELTIQSNYSAWFLSDVWNRPSHWLISMEPNHPIMYHTMLIILEQLLKLVDVSEVALVFVTGPDALKQGYTQCITTGDIGEEPYKQIFKTGIHRLRKPYPNKLVQKFPYKDYIFFNKEDRVPYSINGTKTMITKKKRIQIETNTNHWRVILRDTKNVTTGGKCIDHLYMNAQKQNQHQNP